MTQITVLAILPSLFALSLRGETIELKTGEHIEGAFKQASSAGAEIEVGGQSMTIPLEKVKAIYFGVAPGRTAPLSAAFASAQIRITGLGPEPVPVAVAKAKPEPAPVEKAKGNAAARPSRGRSHPSESEEGAQSRQDGEARGKRPRG